MDKQASTALNGHNAPRIFEVTPARLREFLDLAVTTTSVGVLLKDGAPVSLADLRRSVMQTHSATNAIRIKEGRDGEYVIDLWHAVRVDRDSQVYLHIKALQHLSAPYRLKLREALTTLAAFVYLCCMVGVPLILASIAVFRS